MTVAMVFTARKRATRSDPFQDVPYDSVTSRRDESLVAAADKENAGPPSSHEPKGKGALSKIMHFSFSKDKSAKRMTGGAVEPFVVQDARANSARGSDLPMGFPTPPPKQQSKYSSTPRRHPAGAFGESPSSSLPSGASHSTMSSMSSFASTALFEESDSSQSEATSISTSSSSPESSPSRSRMWKVKGLVRDGAGQARRQPKVSANPRLSLVVEDEREHRRNSTPIPSCVQVMLADPETPPSRTRRPSSTSSTQPQHDSPAFDLRAEKAARVAPAPAATIPAETIRPSSSDGGSSAGEADDEVSPPRLKAIEEMQNRKRLSGVWGTSQSLKTKARIPSLKFDGISMDAVFDEVERNLERTGGLSGLGIVQLVSGESTTKRDRRKSKVMPVVLSNSSLPKRSSSIRTRPPPLNLSATSFRDSSGALSPTSIYSQPSPRSPPLAGAWSATPTPTRPDFAAATSAMRSAGLLPSPIKENMTVPSPALSSTSTIKEPSSPLPAFSVHPPTPPAPLRARTPLLSNTPSPRLQSPVPSEASTTSPCASPNLSGDEMTPTTTVKIVKQKQYVKLSSRSGYQRQRRWTPQLVTTASPRPVSTALISPTATAAPRTPMAPMLEAAPVFSTVTRKVSLPEILVREPTVPDLLQKQNETASSPVIGTPGSPASSYETDMSEGDEDALQTMLTKLEQPHTPPSASNSSFESLVDNRAPALLAAAASTDVEPSTAVQVDDALLHDLDDVLAGRKRLSSVCLAPSPVPSLFTSPIIEGEDGQEQESEGEPDEEEHERASAVAELCFDEEDKQESCGRTSLIEALKASTFHSDGEDADEDDDDDGMTGFAISTPTLQNRFPDDEDDRSMSDGMPSDVSLERSRSFDDLDEEEEEEIRSASAEGANSYKSKGAAAGWPRSDSISSLASATSFSTLNTVSSSEGGHAVVVMAERVHCAYDSSVGIAY